MALSPGTFISSVTCPASAPAGRRRRAAAFTVGELLVSVGMLALLALLLMVGVQKISGASHAATCVANLRTLGSAMQAYMRDHRGYAPPHNNYAFFETDSAERVRKLKWHWMTHLGAYLGDPEATGAMPAIFDCPADRAVKRWPKPRPFGPQPSGEKAYALSSYGYSYYYFTTAASWWSPEQQERVLPIQRIINPANALLMADGREDANLDPAAPNDPIILPFTKVNWPARRHGGRFNAVFLDGHVAALGEAEAANAKGYWAPRATP